jgi:lysylphosphatidylglycerol synthetase-like protein (DUF2156 family)
MLDQNQLWVLIILLWFTSFVAGVFCGIWSALWRKPQQKIEPTREQQEVYAAMRRSEDLSAPLSEHEMSKKT